MTDASRASGAQRPIAGGVVRISAMRVLAVACAAATSLVLARVLGPVDAGRFAVAVTTVYLLMRLTTLGLEIGVPYLVSQRRWNPGNAFLTMQIAALVLGGAGLALGLALRVVAPHETFADLPGGLAWALLLGLPLWLAWTFASQIALASDRYEAAASIPSVQSLVYFVAVAALASAAGPEGAAWGLLASHVVAVAVALHSARRSGWLAERRGRRSAPLDWRAARAAASFGWRSYGANLVSALKYRLDLILLNAFIGGATVGHYAIALAITSLVPLLPGALASVLFPRVAALSAERDDEARLAVETRTLRHTTLVLAGGGAVLLIVIVTLLEPLYGSSFAPAVTPALILLPGTVALGYSTVLFASLNGRGRPGYALAMSMITGPLTVAAYFLVVPAHGAVGAAVASSVSYATSATLAGLFLARVSERRTLPRLVPSRVELADYRGLVRR